MLKTRKKLVDDPGGYGSQSARRTSFIIRSTQKFKLSGLLTSNRSEGGTFSIIIRRSRILPLLEHFELCHWTTFDLYGSLKINQLKHAFTDIIDTHSIIFIIPRATRKWCYNYYISHNYIIIIIVCDIYVPSIQVHTCTCISHI